MLTCIEIPEKNAVMISHELGYISDDKEVLDRMNELNATLSALITAIKAKVAK